jgi:hypothetical protein
MFAALNAFNNLKKKLDDDMVDSFFEAAEQRPKRPQNRDELIALIKKSNSHRWWRLNYDYKWLRRQMKKHGYNPDDARELL